MNQGKSWILKMLRMMTGNLMSHLRKILHSVLRSFIQTQVFRCNLFKVPLFIQKLSSNRQLRLLSPLSQSGRPVATKIKSANNRRLKKSPHLPSLLPLSSPGRSTNPAKTTEKKVFANTAIGVCLLMEIMN